MKQIGFHAVAVRASLDEAQRMPLPAIIYWKQEHYVVLYKIKESAKGRKYYIVDPSYGKLILQQQEFAKNWTGDNKTGVAVVAEPTSEFYSKVYPPEATERRNGLFKLLKKSLLHHRKQFLWVVILTAIAVVADLISPLLFQRTIDQGIGGRDIGLVWALILGQFAFFIGNYFANNVIDIIISKLGLDIGIKLNRDYLLKLLTLPMYFFDMKITSDLIQKVDDQNRIKNFLVSIPDSILFITINFVVFSCLLLYYNSTVFLVFILLSLLAFFWTRLFLKQRKIIDYSLFSAHSENRNNVYELINGMAEVKINNASEVRLSIWNKSQEIINKLTIKSTFNNFYMSSGNALILRLKDIIITGICATLVIQNEMTIGVMMTISYIVGRLSSPISQLISSVVVVQDAILSYDRVNEILEYPVNSPEKEDTKQSKGQTTEQCICLSNLSFKYPGSFSSYVLKDINLSIDIGKVTAVVGASGSGKSTLLKLILGFYEPQEGNLRIGAESIASIGADQWLSRCGVVMQSGYIFSGTIASNIALSEQKPDLERMRHAARIACLDEFIEGLPMKYNTKIGVNGIDMSGGQKQRLFIARAVYKDPPFIFFDEATSSLDANNEKEIMANLKEFYKNKTVIVIAHRLSTVKDADKIIFLDNGQVAEQGTHHELISRQGAYYTLVKNQLELGN